MLKLCSVPLRRQRISILTFLVFSLCFHISILSAIESQELSKLNQDPQKLYIDLMKKILTNTIYEDASYQSAFDSTLREYGNDHPHVALTMIGMKRLNNVEYCMDQILEHNIPGDFIETGVWRGGCTILMRAILKSYGETTRKVWVADSFEGVPAPNLAKYPADFISPLHTPSYFYLAVPLETVKKNFNKFGLLDEQVVFLKGRFSDTLPYAPIEKLALLRLDGDLYESTMDALVNLYPKLSNGGFIIIDDFGRNPNCVQAVYDYRRANNITESITWIDGDGVFWQKQG